MFGFYPFLGVFRKVGILLFRRLLSFVQAGVRLNNTNYGGQFLSNVFKLTHRSLVLVSEVSYSDGLHSGLF